MLYSSDRFLGSLTHYRPGPIACRSVLAHHNEAQTAGACLVFASSIMGTAKPRRGPAVCAGLFV